MNYARLLCHIVWTMVFYVLILPNFLVLSFSGNLLFLLAYIVLAGGFFLHIRNWYQKHEYLAFPTNPYNKTINPYFHVIFYTGLLLLSSVFYQTFVQPEEFTNNQKILFELIKQSPILMFFHIVVIAPVLEEYVFRGNFMRAWRSKWTGNPTPMLMVSSVLFALPHAFEWSLDLAVYFVMGFILGMCYYRGKLLRYSIMVHIINNLISFIQAYYFTLSS